MNIETITRNLAKLDALLELELQEMTQFLKSRKTRLDQILDALADTPEEAEDLLSNADYELLMVAKALTRLDTNLPPYVSNRIKE
jgi:hypothetical protein